MEVRPLGLEAHVPRVLGLALGFQHLFKKVQKGLVFGGGFLGDGLLAVKQIRELQPQHMVKKARRLQRHKPPPRRSLVAATRLLKWDDAGRRRGRASTQQRALQTWAPAASTDAASCHSVPVG